MLFPSYPRTDAAALYHHLLALGLSGLLPEPHLQLRPTSLSHSSVGPLPGRAARAPQFGVSGSTCSPKVSRIVAFWALVFGLEPSFFAVLGSRQGLGCELLSMFLVESRDLDPRGNHMTYIRGALCPSGPGINIDFSARGVWDFGFRLGCGVAEALAAVIQDNDSKASEKDRQDLPISLWWRASEEGSRGRSRPHKA